jgi:hypothetical protein
LKPRFADFEQSDRRTGHVRFSPRRSRAARLAKGPPSEFKRDQGGTGNTIALFYEEKSSLATLRDRSLQQESIAQGRKATAACATESGLG